MYSMVLMLAMATGSEAPDCIGDRIAARHAARSGCSGASVTVTRTREFHVRAARSGCSGNVSVRAGCTGSHAAPAAVPAPTPPSATIPPKMVEVKPAAPVQATPVVVAAPAYTRQVAVTRSSGFFAPRSWRPFSAIMGGCASGACGR